MRRILAKCSICFLFLAVSFLICFSHSVGNAQSNSTSGCKYKWKLEYVWKNEPVRRYNSVTGTYETEYELNYVKERRYVYSCDPDESESNSVISRNGKPNIFGSNAIRDAEIRLSLGLRPPYAGQYSGKWVTTYSDAGEQRGEWALSVDANGKITGKEVNVTFDALGNISGFVSENGHIELNIKYGGIFKDALPALMKGIISNVENRHLKGTLKQYDSEKVTSVIEIDLAPIRIEPKPNLEARPIWEDLKEADSLREQGKYSKAIEIYTNVINRIAENEDLEYDAYQERTKLLEPAVYEHRADAKLELKDYRGAITDYNKVFQIYGGWQTEEKARIANGGKGITTKMLFLDFSKLHHKRGVAKAFLGDKVGASDDFQKACSLGLKEGC